MVGGRYAGGGEGRRLEGHTDGVISLVKCGGRMCSGSGEGSFRVWNAATLEQERVVEGDADDSIVVMAVWEGEVISGHASGMIRVWDVGSGQPRRELEGHDECVFLLHVCGSRLASGSDDHSIKVWTMGPGAYWPCERTLAGHILTALTGWEGKLIGGSEEDTIRVWDAGTGALDATLRGHQGEVHALVVMGERLFSAAADGTIRAWTVGTWAAVASVEAYDVRGSGQLPWCLAADGPRLISGSAAPGDAEEGVRYEVRAWDPATMACEHTVRQPAGAEVRRPPPV